MEAIVTLDYIQIKQMLVVFKARSEVFTEVITQLRR